MKLFLWERGSIYYVLWREQKEKKDIPEQERKYSFRFQFTRLKQHLNPAPSFSLQKLSL